LTNLATIYLDSNNLVALHPKMFSHLELVKLDLQRNPCIDKEWDEFPMDIIEQDLATCGAGYLLHEQQKAEKN
jgi:hypothetical protein